MKHEQIDHAKAEALNVEKALRVMGAQIWQPQDVQKHMRDFAGFWPEVWAGNLKFMKILFVGTILTGLAALACRAMGLPYFNTLLVATMLLFVAIILSIATAYFTNDISWRTNWLFTDGPRQYTYMKDDKNAAIPKIGEKIVQNVRTMWPKAMFSVTFFGRDPILNCTIDGITTYHVLVWVENSDGTMTIIPPPSRG